MNGLAGFDQINPAVERRFVFGEAIQRTGRIRHQDVIGGRSDCMSCGQPTLKLGAWKRASWFNARHMNFAWLSLGWVMFTDLYVRLCSMGIITDLNTWS